MGKKQPITSEDYKAIISQQERHIYNLSQLLEISKSFASTLESKTLSESLLYTCLGQMHVLAAGIFSLKQLGSSDYRLDESAIGFDLQPQINYAFKETEGLIPFLHETEKSASMDELEEVLKDTYDLTILKSLNATLAVPMIYQKHIVGILVLGQRIFGEEEAVFTEEEKKQILDIATLAALSINTAMLIEQSSTDMLTHLKLRHFFFNMVNNRIATAKETNTPLAIVMLDIDHFKRFNDIYGHACGDFVLQRIAYILQDNIRSDDIVARYGGEEFVLMLYNVTEYEADKVTERIRGAVEHDDIVFSDIHMQVTLSAGYTVFYPDEAQGKKIKLEYLVNLADEAMYNSKHQGRNRVTYLPLNCETSCGRSFIHHESSKEN